MKKSAFDKGYYTGVASLSKKLEKRSSAVTAQVKRGIEKAQVGATPLEFRRLLGSNPAKS